MSAHTRRQRSGLTHHGDFAWGQSRGNATAGEAARSRGMQGGGQLGQKTFMKGEGKVSSKGGAHLRMFIYLWADRVDVSGQRASGGLEIEDMSEEEGDEGRGRALG